MKPILTPISLLLALAFSHATHAFYCNSRLVSVNDTIEKVRRLCGAPTQQEHIQVKLTKKHFDGRETTRYRSLDYWLYDFGSNRFLRFLRFEDGDLVEVTKGGYGGLRKSTPSNCRPNWSKFDKPHTMPYVRYRCGEPSKIEEKGEHTENIRSGPAYDVFVSIRTTEWQYPTDSADSVSVIQFLNGKLHRMFREELKD